MHTVKMTPVIERLVHTYLRRHPASVCVGSIDNLTECVEQSITFEFFYFAYFYLGGNADIKENEYDLRLYTSYWLHK